MVFLRNITKFLLNITFVLLIYLLLGDFLILIGNYAGNYYVLLVFHVLIFIYFSARNFRKHALSLMEKMRGFYKNYSNDRSYENNKKVEQA